MTRYVTINLFDVEHSPDVQRLSDTLDAFSSLPIDQRWRSDIRLDHIARAPADDVLKSDAYHLDFAKRRDIGPGRLSHAAALGDVGLASGESFGEETAALYLPSRKWILVLHNQYGVGPGRIAAYLNALDPGRAELDYALSPRIDANALKRMRSMPSFAEVEVSANVGAFSDTGEAMGESVAESARQARAQRVYLKLMANKPHGRGEALNMQAARRMLSGLLRRNDDVQILRVRSSDESVDVQDRVVDLIEHKIRQKYPDSMLRVEQHRYTYDSKIDLLRRACRGWLDSDGYTANDPPSD